MTEQDKKIKQPLNWREELLRQQYREDRRFFIGAFVVFFAIPLAVHAVIVIWGQP